MTVDVVGVGLGVGSGVGLGGGFDLNEFSVALSPFFLGLGLGCVGFNRTQSLALFSANQSILPKDTFVCSVNSVDSSRV